MVRIFREARANARRRIRQDHRPGSDDLPVDFARVHEFLRMDRQVSARERDQEVRLRLVEGELHRQIVWRLDSLHIREIRLMHAFFRVAFVGKLNVSSLEDAPIEWCDILPFYVRRELERVRQPIRRRLPCCRQLGYYLDQRRGGLRAALKTKQTVVDDIRDGHCTPGRRLARVHDRYVPGDGHLQGSADLWRLARWLRKVIWDEPASDCDALLWCRRRAGHCL